MHRYILLRCVRNRPSLAHPSPSLIPKLYGFAGAGAYSLALNGMCAQHLSNRPNMPEDRIVIVDDHPMFRDALAQCLRGAYPDAEVLEAETWPEALAVARDGTPPQLFVLDLLFPGMDGPSSVSALRTEFTAASIIIVTMLEDPLVAAQMIDAGADGFLGKGLASDTILQGIHAVRAGEYVVNLASSSPSIAGEKPVLTPRQKEIIQSLCEGKTNKAIARDLGLSHFTVRNHVSILMRTLKIQKRSQFSQRAQALGLISSRDPGSR